MKAIDRTEIFMFIMGFIFFAIVFFGTGFYFMFTKNQMCKDFGMKMYHRELSWVECLVL